MKKIYHLSTCNTCKKILKEIDPPEEFDLQDIKKEALSTIQLNELHELAGSYEAIFSKRAKLYKDRGLKNQDLKEEDYKNLILEHYTFLKRPIIINKGEMFVGNAKKVVEAAKNSLHE